MRQLQLLPRLQPLLLLPRQLLRLPLLPRLPGPKPHNATGLCNDGVYAMSTSKSAACRGHQGVKEWYAAAPAAAAPAAATGCTCSDCPCCAEGGTCCSPCCCCCSGGCSGEVECNYVEQDSVDDSGCGRRSWTCLGEYIQQRLPLLRVELLRQDQRGVLYVGDRRQGQGRACGSREGLH